uniref:Uncharacterized protein n=1 Tax=viral metagenome TaxID=1070528 RepID=A0A6C0ECY4_9ZZZZ
MDSSIIVNKNGHLKFIDKSIDKIIGNDNDIKIMIDYINQQIKNCDAINNDKIKFTLSLLTIFYKHIKVNSIKIIINKKMLCECNNIFDNIICIFSDSTKDHLNVYHLMWKAECTNYFDKYYPIFSFIIPYTKRVCHSKIDRSFINKYLQDYINIILTIINKRIDKCNDLKAFLHDTNIKKLITNVNDIHFEQIGTLMMKFLGHAYTYLGNVVDNTNLLSKENIEYINKSTLTVNDEIKKNVKEWNNKIIDYLLLYFKNHRRTRQIDISFYIIDYCDEPINIFKSYYDDLSATSKLAPCTLHINSYIQSGIAAGSMIL